MKRISPTYVEKVYLMSHNLQSLDPCQQFCYIIYTKFNTTIQCYCLQNMQV